MPAVQTRYYVTAFACFERFMPLCYPYKHGVNMAVRNIGKIILLVALFLQLMNWSLYVTDNKIKEGKAVSSIISEATTEGLATNVTMFPQVDSAKAQLKGGGKGGRVKEDRNETSADSSTGSNSTEISSKDGKNKAGNIKSILGQLFFRFEIQLLPILIVMMSSRVDEDEESAKSSESGQRVSFSCYLHSHHFNHLNLVSYSTLHPKKLQAVYTEGL